MGKLVISLIVLTTIASFSIPTFATENIGGGIKQVTENNVDYSINFDIHNRLINWYASSGNGRVYNVVNHGKYIDDDGNHVYKYTVFYNSGGDNYEHRVNSYSQNGNVFASYYDYSNWSSWEKI